jgi:hypothetical protein
MASDIVLVLRSDHRQLLLLAEQCRRPSRGLERPEEALRRALAAHVEAVGTVVYPPVASRADPDQLRPALSAVAAHLENPSRTGLAESACALVEVESSTVIPALAALPIADRRRMGKVFRIHQERRLRHAAPLVRRQRSQTELYELARRAGLARRSRMTQSQLEEAVSAWEREQASRSAQESTVPWLRSGGESC